MHKAVTKIASCRVNEVSERDIERVGSCCFFLINPLKIAKYWAESSQFKVWFMALSDSPGTTLQD